MCQCVRAIWPRLRCTWKPPLHFCHLAVFLSRWLSSDVRGAVARDIGEQKEAQLMTFADGY